LKAACGAGGTYKDGALELQGDHRDRVEAALRTRGLRSKRTGG
jgi:translation initiation factor 1